ncbi:MAG TPA: hypothetical protein DEA73_07535 [Peptococcaceae bacterium]|nr:MAG: BFD domain protein (2Fe-2S)-binding domain protein [Moorella sp. 60_41]HBT47709.1 hypothetical protein [Peptococcaceae bacterium]
MLADEKASLVGDEAYFLCPTPSCDVVYYSPSGRSFSRDEVKVAVWLKEEGPDVPLCYCRGVTRRQILQALERGCPPTPAAVMEFTGAGQGAAA